MTKRVKEHVRLPWPEFRDNFLAFVRRRRAGFVEEIEEDDIPADIQAEIDSELP